MTEYIAVLGGYPDVGKGILSASIAYLLKHRGNKISIMKFDGYFNTNSGTMNHSEYDFSCQYNDEEVFVLSDGFCGDSDTGVYERFLNTDLTCKHNITNGMTFASIIEKEKEGGFPTGKILELNDIKRQLYSQLIEAGKGNDFVVIEVGGTIGDSESVYFIELLQEMKNKGNKVKLILLAPVIKFIDKSPGSIISSETKIIRMAAEKLKRKGITFDALVCRSEGLNDIYESNRESLSQRCDVPIEMVFLDPKCDTIYKLPSILEEQSFIKKLFPEQGQINEDPLMDFIERLNSMGREIKISIFGNTESNGSFVSLNEALLHSCVKEGVLPSIRWEKEFNGNIDADLVILTDGLGDAKELISKARKLKIPFLAICSGFISVLSLLSGKKPDVEANHLGAFEIELSKEGIEVYGMDAVNERYRFKGKAYSGLDIEGITILGKINNSPHFVSADNGRLLATLFHPEYSSRPERSHPIIDKMISEVIK